MGFRFEIPAIGTTATKFAQKGPTCWYYAAKMLLKFHKKVENREENRIYEEFKQLHELRKELTELGSMNVDGLAKMRMRRRYDDMRAWTSEEVEETIRIRRGILEQIPEVSKEQIENIVSDLRECAKRTPDPKAIQRLKNAVEILETKIKTNLQRLELLTNFVPTAGFFEIEVKFAEPGHVEDTLRKVGPFYAGGGLAIRRKVKSTDLLRNAKEGEPIDVRALEWVNELDANSPHAIVIAGVKGESLYVVDPNASNEVRVINFAEFRTNVSQGIAVKCPDCPHMATQLREV